MAKKSYKIPFDDAGNQLHYPDGWGGVNMRDNFEFDDVIYFHHFSRGRSAAYAIFERHSTGTQITVFLSDLQDMVPRMNGGKVVGTFTFVKKGQNYGCALAKI